MGGGFLRGLGLLEGVVYVLSLSKESINNSSGEGLRGIRHCALRGTTWGNMGGVSVGYHAARRVSTTSFARVSLDAVSSLREQKSHPISHARILRERRRSKSYWLQLLLYSRSVGT